MKVSIIIPTYNRSQMVMRAVKSVLNQTYSNWECIVVDDGSTDATKEKILSLKDSRIKYICQKQQGVAAARNNGVKKAKHDWLAFLDSDDEWEKDKLEKQILYLKENPQYKVVQTYEKWIRHGKFVNQMEKHKMEEGFIFEKCLPLSLISPSALLIEKKLFIDIGGFDPAFPVCEDYDLWLRLTVRNPIGLVKEPLTTHYGGHLDQLSKSTWGLDRFRLKALKKILKYSLSPDQKDLVKKEAVKKIKVLQKGALKRKRFLYWLNLQHQLQSFR